MCMDTRTGYVKAYVGGPDYRYFQYDMAGVGRRRGRVHHQAPSSIRWPWKTVCRPATLRRTYNRRISWPASLGHPATAAARYGEMVTLKWGLAQSNNWISAYLMSRLSPSALVRLIHEFGVLNRDIHPSMSLCLGPCEISVAEMVSSYTAFANRGIRMAPLFRVADRRQRRECSREFQPRMTEVISEESAYKMIIMLQGVMNGGTGGRMRFRYNVNADMGGKTGTTNRNSDGWFVCFTPSLSAGCWVGGEDRDIHFNSMTYGQGSLFGFARLRLFLPKRYIRTRPWDIPPTRSSKFPKDFDPCQDTILTEEAPVEEYGGIDEVFE